MKTVILEQPGNFTLTDTDIPANLPNDEALVKVHRIGVCGTDLHAFKGRQPFFSYPRILGHELGVEILEVAPNRKGLKPGDRCTIEPYINCGECGPCLHGRPNCCTQLKVLGVSRDGGMREQIQIPIRKLHKSETLSLEQLALVETLCIGSHAVSRANPQPGEYALIIGAGPIGLAVLEFVNFSGAVPIMMDISANRLEFCLNRLGVAHTVNGADNPMEQILGITHGDLPTFVFDATGNPNSMMASIQYLSNGGTLVFVGIFVGDFTLNDTEFHRRETTLLSSRNSSPSDFARTIRLMESAKINTEPWISEIVSPERALDRFPYWTDPANGIIKAMINFSGV